MSKMLQSGIIQALYVTPICSYALFLGWVGGGKKNIYLAGGKKCPKKLEKSKVFASIPTCIESSSLGGTGGLYRAGLKHNVMERYF